MNLKFYFPLGKLVATPHALSQVPDHEILTAISRHRSCDWGTVCKEDRQANNEALLNGARLLSSYVSEAGVTFWILTEADRSVTTVLLPEDY